jgi:hypothetical protein
MVSKDSDSVANGLSVMEFTLSDAKIPKTGTDAGGLEAIRLALPFGTPGKFGSVGFHRRSAGLFSAFTKQA